MPLAGKLPPLVVILGATATGKTGLSLELADIFGGEIVNADSRQIYRGMDIGTAKATPAQQQRIPHHLLDIATPAENPGLAEYQTLAYQAIEAIHARGRLPFLVGGTGQYLTAVTEGWSIPQVPPNPDLRAHLEEYARMYGNQALHDWLIQMDPPAAATIHPNNVRRVVRALEVYLETGTPISELQQRRPPPYRILTIGLHLRRELLYPRADQRVDEMLAAGFLAEVRRLLMEGYTPELPAMHTLGYAELGAHLLDGLPLAEAIQRTKYHTHDFIRRQEVWFRGHDHGILWHNVEGLNIAEPVTSIRAWLTGD